MPHHLVYGLDIETEVPQGAVDPRIAPLRRVALSTPAREQSFDGSERHVLQALDAAIASLAPGIIATWNGSSFDLPYLADRAGICGVRLGLHLVADPRIARRGEILAGHRSAYRACWYDHRHLDAARLFRSGRRPLIPVDELLRSVGWRGHRRRAIGPADLPGGELSHEAAHAYASNDARLVRTMIEGRLPGVLRRADRVAGPTGPAPATASGRRAGRVPRSPAHPAVRAAMAAAES